MLLPFTVAAIPFFGSLLIYGTAIHLIIHVVVRLNQRGTRALGFWKSIVVMANLAAITATAHLTQIALWAVAYLLCGQASTLEMAFYFSAQSYTALGYGDILLSERWRLLGPLESINGLVFFGLSTAVLFEFMRELIRQRLRSETGKRIELARNQTPGSGSGSVAGGARSI